MRLLASSERSIVDIALDVGCSCQSHLTTMFRKHTGTTPGSFRRASQRGQAASTPTRLASALPA
jgi:AraC-like DNA-binding protein